MKRRSFLQMMVAAALAGGSVVRGEQAAPVEAATGFELPRRKLGTTAIEASILGMGTGSVGWNGQSNQTRLGRARFVSLLEYAHDRGITYFDLADQYGSHTFMRDALKVNGGTIERDKIMILSKSMATSADQMRADLDRFRKEIGTEYIDVLLLHCKTGGDWNTSHRGAMDVLGEAKQKGIVRAHGVSCHSLAALQKAADEPWVEVDLARYNPWNKYMDADKETVGTVLRKMKSAGKGVIGMKILAQGEKKSAEDLKMGLEHAMRSELLDMFTIGFESREQIDGVIAGIKNAVA